MLNKQLETNINKQRLLRNLAENLNIDFISDGSTLKKIADVNYNESVEFSSIVDKALSSGFLTTMDDQSLELFGRQYNVPRKRYNNLVIDSREEAIVVRIDKRNSLITDISDPYLLLEEGRDIYIDSNFSIKVLEDIYFTDINQEIFIPVRVTLNSRKEVFNISKDSIFTIETTNNEYRRVIPFLELQVKKPIGLAVAEESIPDYKSRLLEATYIANNGANSAISSLLKEVPLVHYVETEDYREGKGIKVIFPYTDNLIINGNDPYIGSYIVPMMESNLENKVIYGQLIDIEEPQPLLIFLDLRDNRPEDSKIISEADLDNIRLQFNQYFFKEKSISKESFEVFLLQYLSEYGFKGEDFNFVFSSTFVSEEVFNWGEREDSYIHLPAGRFPYLNSINTDNIYVIPDVIPIG